MCLDYHHESKFSTTPVKTFSIYDIIFPNNDTFLYLYSTLVLFVISTKNLNYKPKLLALKCLICVYMSM